MNKKTLGDALAAKEEAITQVEKNANEAWIEFMLGIHRLTAIHTPKFTSEDVRERYDEDRSEDKPVTHEPRAIGAVMRRAAKYGWCRPTDEYVRSRYRHCAPLLVWESLICEKRMAA